MVFLWEALNRGLNVQFSPVECQGAELGGGGAGAGRSTGNTCKREVCY